MQLVTEECRESATPSPLGRAVPRWLSTVPLYRNRRFQDLSDVLSDPEGSLRRLPLITKEDIRIGFPGNFLPLGQDLDTMLESELVELEHTSGTSEDRTPLILGSGWWQAQEERALRRNRFVADVFDEFPGVRRVTLNSPFCSGDICYYGTPSHGDRIVGSSLYVGLNRHPLLWDDWELRRIAQETLDWQPQFLDVDPVYAVPFALFCERNGIRIPGLQFVLSSYEYLSVVHRRILERAFRVPVYNLYGSTETGHLLMENELGQMVPSLETAHLEVIDADTCGVGELIVTTLTNEFMPLIRYQIGDLVQLLGTESHSHYAVHGRRDSCFQKSDGSRVTSRHVDQAFADILGIKHYRLARSRQGCWVLALVPEAEQLSGNVVRSLSDRLTGLLGRDMKLEVRQESALLAGSSGKFTLFQP
jgi:phenylacetate-CoA ligase